MLRIEKLSKKYKDKIVLEDINLNVDSSNIIGLVGNNGSGKTTLMKCIGNIIRDYKGSIFIKENLSFSLEYPTFFRELTVEENLLLFEKLIENRSEKTIEVILENVGLLNERYKKVKQLSLGMKQKLSIARILLTNNKIILLDEPFNGLDLLMKKQLKEIIFTLKKENRLVIVSSHILEELGEISDIIWYLKDGKIKSSINLNNETRLYTLKILNEDNVSIKFIEENFIVMLKEYKDEYIVITVKIKKQEIYNSLQFLLSKRLKIIEYYDSTNDITNTLKIIEKEGSL